MKQLQRCCPTRNTCAHTQNSKQHIKCIFLIFSTFPVSPKGCGKVHQVSCPVPNHCYIGRFEGHLLVGKMLGEFAIEKPQASIPKTCFHTFSDKDTAAKYLDTASKVRYQVLGTLPEDGWLEATWHPRRLGTFRDTEVMTHPHRPL